MEDTTYNIFLEETLIGTTLLEKADAPMGVVFGEIEFAIDGVNYDFIKEYCTDNNIELGADYPEDKLISTYDIPLLRVVSNTDIEIKGESTYINGMDSDSYEITVEGVPYPFYKEQFPHHVEQYKNSILLKTKSKQ